MKKTDPITQVVAIGIGAALFFVLGRFLSIPSPIPNTSISIQYAVLAVFAVLFGPLVGVAAGAIGHVLVDATGYGIWASWEIATAVFGLTLGLVMLNNKIREGVLPGKDLVKFNLAVVIAHAVAWLVVAPLGDILIYSEPANKVFVQGAFAFASNAVTTCVLGTIILLAYARTRTKSGSLSLEK
ncbi:ECF-type riboflavin transporter substrate-binding protein [Boudabousia marimammalium]|uniref:ECF transporter S component n=1 Tax=Boudabousia marimammalium TaxID=156892 RepID=A0A1Q5PQS7_9ACTO|nr:ECF-type riboflavin transporter substrate-binding protein [Boudabousia marimammalium]OKL49917.1 ECF transporter S component [Boudabousia marimammalium]